MLRKAPLSRASASIYGAYHCMTLEMGVKTALHVYRGLLSFRNGRCFFTRLLFSTGRCGGAWAGTGRRGFEAEREGGSQEAPRDSKGVLCHAPRCLPSNICVRHCCCTTRFTIYRAVLPSSAVVELRENPTL